MRTKDFKIFRLLLVVVMSFMLGSCEEVELEFEVQDSSSNISYSTEYLTSRVWVDEWKDDEGIFYHQELTFYFNHVGADYMYTEDRWGSRTESTYRFTWDWRNARCTSIRMKYGPGDYSYLEDMMMGGNKIDCLFDGQRAYFVGR